MNQFCFVKILFLVLSFSLCCITSQASSCRYSPNRFTYFENDAHVVDSLGVAQSKLALRYQKEFSKFKIAVLADTEFLIQLYDKLSKRNNKYLLNSTEAKYLNTLKVGHSFQTGDIVGENQLEYIFLGVNYYLAQKKASQSAYFYRSLDKEAVLQESLNSLIISLRDSSLRKKVEENPLVFYSA
ncbi:MAG: hypothetical protein VX642_01230, partial [Bdellovibrionota bacterium]|nr:hypothetical protein [Bdellovibrionota bacterium]